MNKASHVITTIAAIILFFYPHFVFAQTAGLMPMAVQQFFDNNGNPLSAGTVTTYIAGTSTLKTTWRDSAETVPNTNPIVLDAAGRAIIYGDGNYRQLVKDRLGNIVWDAVTSAFGTGSASQLGDGTAVGTILPWSGLVAPARYAFAYGQELSRATYSALYTSITLTTNVACTSSSNILTGISDTTQIPIGAAVEVSCVAAGTTVTAKTASTVTVSNNASVTLGATAIFFPWGNGNGTTTFNVPDLRGRVLPGRDNMGGTAAARLTTAIYGAANPDSLGGAGGSQTHTLVTGNLPAYTPTGTVTDSGHTHGLGNNLAYVFTASAGSIVLGNGGTNLLNSASGTANSTFAGVAQGGTSTPFATIQPSITLNYIVKILPDVSISTLNVVTSLGGMVGDVTCSGVIVCSANNISVAGIGSGDVVGPASATDNAIAQFNGITGKLIKNSNVVLSSGSIFSPNCLDVNKSGQANKTACSEGPVFIWSDPAHTIAGEASAVKIWVGNNPTATPGPDDFTAVQIFTVNDNPTRANMWLMNLGMIYAGGVGNPDGSGHGIEVNGYSNYPQADAVQSPWGGGPRKNFVELVASSGGAQRITTALMTFADDTTGTMWFENGIALSRVYSKGFLVANLVTDTTTPFKTCAFCDESSSANIIKVTSGVHTNFLDLSNSGTITQFVKGYSGSDTALGFGNQADHGMTLVIDSGNTAAQGSVLTFADRGGGKWAFSKTSANNFSFDNVGSLTVYDVNTSTNLFTFNTNVTISGGVLDILGGTLQANSVPMITRNPGTGVLTLNSNAGNIVMTPGSGVVAITGTLTASAVASNTGAQTGYLCYNTSGGVITYDGTNTCLVSSARFKTLRERITPEIGLATILQLSPLSYTYRQDNNLGLPSGIQEGFFAEEVAKIDPNLAVYFADGSPRSIKYEQITAKLVAAVTALKAANDNLRERLERLEAK